MLRSRDPCFSQDGGAPLWVTTGDDRAFRLRKYLAAPPALARAPGHAAVHRLITTLLVRPVADGGASFCFSSELLAALAPPPWTDRGSSRSAPTSRLPRRPASRPQFPEEKRGSRMRPGGGASERERGGGGRRRWTRATRTSEAAAAARAAAHARGRGQVKNL